MQHALISNIQKYTIHDGPGIRTEVFFMGCTLRCIWCSNPEAISPKPRLGVYPSKCLGLDKCGWCVKSCPAAAPPIRHGENGVLRGIAAAECSGCFRCAEACPARAIKVWGEYMTVPQLMKIILEDSSFYQKTGGGVTLSGGEVMAQAAFAARLLVACRAAGVHTCVETALHCPWDAAEPVLELADMVITDVKHMDAERHRAICGAGNALILENITKLGKMGKKAVVRTPVTAGWNDDDANMRRTAGFIKNALGGNLMQYQLLPYRKMGTEKYDSLGEPYPMGDYAPPERAEWEANLTRLADMLTAEFGIPVVAGSAKRLTDSNR